MKRTRSKEELVTSKNMSASGQMHNSSRGPNGGNDNAGPGAVTTDSNSMSISDTTVSGVNGGIPFNGQVSTEEAINITQSDRAVLLSARRQQRQRGNSDVGMAQEVAMLVKCLCCLRSRTCSRPSVEYPSKKK